jgi:hypothetical protein
LRHLTKIMKIVHFGASSIRDFLLAIPRRAGAIWLVAQLATLAVQGAPPKKGVSLPDFTKGDAIPADAKHDWNLGTTGLRGWMYFDRMVTTDARQVFITKVEKISPADGKIAVGDVILGVNGKPFAMDPRTEWGKALTIAEASPGGEFRMTRWRAGKTEEVVLKLPVLGAYSATAPYDCKKSALILERGCKALAASLNSPQYRPNPIVRALNALALLASGNAEFEPLVKREAEWAASFSTDGFQTWYYGYVMMFLAEYQMATKDDSVLPGLRRLALEAAKGQSAVGSWGHKFAEPSGRLSGYGMMNSPGVPLTTAMILSRAAGVKEPALDEAIERSAKLLRFYIGKGSIPYGDHPAWTQTHDDNGKNGMVATMFQMLGESQGAEFFSKMSVASHGAERDAGHTGNFFNVLWAMPGVSHSGPQATGAWMQEFGHWYFDLARRWDGSFAHLGPPEAKNDSYAGWDASGAYLLAYALPLKKIYLTGKRASIVKPLDAKSAASLIADGRGWNNKDRTSYYDAMSEKDLLGRLGSWSPTVRERAAQALSRRKPVPLTAVIAMLDAPSMEARYGACEALALFKESSAPAVPKLMQAFHDKDLWLRVCAANALAAIGDPAMSAVPALLERMVVGSTKEDPRAMEQRYLCSAVFGKMLKRSLDGVDRELMRKAVIAGLQNQDGRARGEIGGIYQRLSYEDIKPLLPAIREAIVTPAPSGEMFASGIRLSGVELLAKHRIREGMTLCLQVMEIDKWGKKDRIGRCLKIMAMYGAAAKPMLPQLRQLEKDFLAHPEAKSLVDFMPTLQKLIKDIENGTEAVELRSLENP